MPLSNKWWILCAVSISFLTRFGSCRKVHGVPPEPFIFNELCALKDEAGPCRAIKDRYFFNVNSGRCELFEYGGCGGNKNNFETLEECEETCLVSDDKKPCHLPEAPGPCRGMVSRYFFDSSNQQCRRFYYGGCFGNANNFRTMAECQAKCLSPGELSVSEPVVQMNDTNPETNELSRSEPCFRPVDRGTCDGAERRFAYNPEKKRCQSFSYSGCGGNENNFISRKHCIHKCIRKGHGKGMMIRIKRKNINSIVNRSS
ncbi:tissue factor pathway inhibitor a isoform X2 [Archocentrus centrarchus]|uniref:tissue factor pathway inhibitor a isoform X2 n=1 Tax=Archocentrus centrarchus TaxID=63155 RepID=UPI0011E9DA4C|nr:tissue factor pathway inhibitor-like isoform X2 [Archocentrus centrarchus]